MASLENERFPKGLRVLVVDDDNTSLKLMDNLLRRCHFQVTTTNQAKEALRILKANKNKYDIVISDVEMPDMNGIQLLQIIGLEMDLPVIMLSAYSDIKRVSDGVMNGACDYLVKPVRIQELQNIWQHVLRRKQKAVGGGKIGRNAPGNRRDGPGEGSRDDNNNNDDDDDDMDDGNEDPATQKKPRLFWSVELHQKFVDAVNQLGLDKAFPKKILDLMNVEGLTREKVASHLQKYRLYLRKISSGSSLQPAGNRPVSVGTEDSHIGGGYGVYRSLAGPGSYPGYSSLPDQAGLLGRLNAATGLSFRGLPSSPLLQTTQFPNSSNSFNPTVGRFDPLSFSANQNANLFQGNNPTTMQINNRPPLLSPPTTSSMMLNTREFGSQSSLISPSSNLGTGSSTFSVLDPSRKVSWGNPIQPVMQPLSCPQNLLPTNNVSGDITTPLNAQIQSVDNDPLEFLYGTDQNAQSQQRPTSLNNVNIPGGHGQQIQKPNYFMNLCNISNTSSSLIPAVALTPGENSRQINNMIGVEDTSPQSQQQIEAQKSFDDSTQLGDPKLQYGTDQNTSETLDDIVGRFLKQGNGEAASAQENLELDPFLMK